MARSRFCSAQRTKDRWRRHWVPSRHVTRHASGKDTVWEQKAARRQPNPCYVMLYGRDGFWKQITGHDHRTCMVGNICFSAWLLTRGRNATRCKAATSSGITTGCYTALCCLSVSYGVLCRVWRLYLPCDMLDGSRRDNRRTR